MLEPLIDWDRKIFLWLNPSERSWLDYVLGWPTFLGSTLILLGLILGLVFLGDRKHWRLKYLFLAMGILLTDLASHGLKFLIARPRPFSYFEDRALITVLFNSPVSSSFPSGHAALAFAAVVLANAFYRQRFYFLYPLAFLVAFSRIYVGVHYPSDVVAGALLGTAVALGFLAFLRGFFPSLYKNLQT